MSFAYGHHGFARPGLGVGVLVVMTAWTVAATLLLADPLRRTPLLLSADLAVAAGCLLAGIAVQGTASIDRAADPSLTLSWGVVPVLAWAVRSGPWAGGGAALVMSAATVVWRGTLTRATVGSCVLMLLTGVVVGYVVRLARQAEVAYADVTAREAAAAERDRLAREVHDGVLQALALVASRVADPELAGFAKEQEAALRRLVSAPAPVSVGSLDLRDLLPATVDVQVAAPAGPVVLPAAVARSLAAAVHACLSNVRHHGGGQAWLLVEDEPGGVTVTVRDEGPGIPAGRLEEAAGQGRLGVASSVRGRVEELGGTVTIVSAPGQGTEVELHVPRP